MKELKADVFEIYDQHPWCTICIPSNGCVTKAGKAVMGKGVARQAAQRWRHLPAVVGRHISEWGNRVVFIEHRVLAFPTKGIGAISTGSNVVKHLQRRFPPGRTVPGWATRSTLQRIALSLEQLKVLHRLCGLGDVYLPRPGCGAGGLDWTSVQPLCKKLEDWLIIMHI